MGQKQNKMICFLPLCTLLLLLLQCSRISVKETKNPLIITPNWSMNGGNPQRTNSYQWKLYLPLQLAWEYKASSAVERTIVAADSIIFFGTKDGKIEAVNIGTGARVGDKKMLHALTCAYTDQKLIIAKRYGNETLYHYDMQQNKFLWKTDAGDISTEPLILSNAVVVTALYNHVDLYELDTGTRIWKYETDDQIRSSPASAHGILIFGCDDHNLYAIDQANGQLKWQFKTNAPVQSTPAIDIESKIVYSGSLDSHFYALELETGQKLWDFQANGKIYNGIALDDDKVIFGSTDHNVYCLSADDGELLWKFTAGSVISTNPLIARDVVLFGSLDGSIYIVDLKNGKLKWQYQTERRIRTSPIVWGEYLIYASEDYLVRAFKFKAE